MPHHASRSTSPPSSAPRVRPHIPPVPGRSHFKPRPTGGKWRRRPTSFHATARPMQRGYGWGRVGCGGAGAPRAGSRRAYPDNLRRRRELCRDFHPPHAIPGKPGALSQLCRLFQVVGALSNLDFVGNASRIARFLTDSTSHLDFARKPARRRRFPTFSRSSRPLSPTPSPAQPLTCADTQGTPPGPTTRQPSAQPQQPHRVLLQDQRPHLIADRQLLEVRQPPIGRDQGEV
jgi:hypothetical protein